MIRYAVLLVTFLSLFWLPWQYSVVFMLIASTFFPLSGILFGVLFDVLYAPLGFVGLPLGIVWGATASLVGFGLSRFISARIMSA